MNSLGRKFYLAAKCKRFLRLCGIRVDRFDGFTQKRFKSFRPSYVHGAGLKPMIGATIGHFVDIIPESKHAEREALVDCHQGIRRTYLQYKEDIDKLAAGFLSLNLKRGDRIGIWLPNRYEWPVTQLAASKCGLVLVTLNPAYQVPELEYCIKKLSIRCMVIQESFKTQQYYDMLTKIIPEIADSKPSSKVKSVTHPYFDTLIMTTDKSFPGAFRYHDIMEAGGNNERQILEDLQFKLQFDDPVMVQFTSGTTGAPKATTLSHHSIINGSYQATDILGYGEDAHRTNVPLPLFHGFGCIGLINGGLIHGNCSVLPAPDYNPGKILKSIEEERCTQLSGSPTIFIDLLNHPNFSKTDFSSVKLGIIGSAPCTPHLLKRIINEMHCPGLFVSYGATEVAGFFISRLDDSFEDRVNTSGRVYPHMEAKLIDREGNIVPIGTEGEICGRGYKVMLGYWGDEEKTKEVLDKNGWYKTGDIGILNENGTIQIRGRIKEMLIRGGENIFPVEIEKVLVTHPKIAEAHVVGVPDERMGEEVCAWIRLKDNQTMEESEVKEFCKGKIAHFKIPRYIKFVTEYPRTAVGKVQKFNIREEMIKILNSK